MTGDARRTTWYHYRRYTQPLHARAPLAALKMARLRALRRVLVDALTAHDEQQHVDAVTQQTALRQRMLGQQLCRRTAAGGSVERGLAYARGRGSLARATKRMEKASRRAAAATAAARQVGEELRLLNARLGATA